LIPLWGAILYAALYVVAANYYPGGSPMDKNAVGFSWMDNYWCNLLNEIAINGQPNPARPIALAAMAVICLSLAFFWYLFPRDIPFGKAPKLIIQGSGIMAMVVAAFIATSFHNIVIYLASLFGVIALIGTFIGLVKMKWHRLFRIGLANLVLVALNNYLYYTKGLLLYLPLIQKITFAFFLIWMCCIVVKLYKNSAAS